MGMSFETTHGSVVIRATLYGDVSDARLAREKLIAKHRAEQMAPPDRKRRAPRVQQEDALTDLYEELGEWL